MMMERPKASVRTTYVGTLARTLLISYSTWVTSSIDFGKYWNPGRYFVLFLFCLDEVVWLPGFFCSNTVLILYQEKMSKTLSMTVGETMRVAYQRWGQGNPIKVLCCHGWLDNSNSFSYLGPLLADKFGFDVVAIDHPGHGRSSHFHQLTSYSIFGSFLFPAQEHLGWSKSHVIGHSMGANLSLVFAGSFPERVEKLVLIEGIGPPSNKIENAPKNFRKAVLAEHDMHKKTAAGKTRKVYETITDAIESRVKVVTTYPGTQYISKAAATTIIARAAVRAKATHYNEFAGDFDFNQLDVHNSNLGPVRLHYDPKLVLPTLMQFTEEEV
jgi:pimeloyl-ACP methyl ester carboxylesterase